MTSLLSELPFGALLTYSPRGEGAESARSRKVRDALKAGDPRLLSRAAELAREHFDQGRFQGILAPGATLIPAPRSSPLRDPEALWPPRSVCEHLVAHGLGHELVASLRRTEAVPQAAYARAGERPTLERHLETMTVDRPLGEPQHIVIVDDVVTQGRMLLAAASLLQEAFPSARVTAFALLRTMGFVPDIERIVDPCEGTIRRVGDDVDRQP